MHAFILKVYVVNDSCASADNLHELVEWMENNFKMHQFFLNALLEYLDCLSVRLDCLHTINPASMQSKGNERYLRRTG